MLLLCGSLITSCENGRDDYPNYAYLGGEIVNPTTDHVILKYHGNIIDTVDLDDRNRFSYKLENAEKGLYLLHHKPEVQNVHISPGDSLLLRVNTLAFDESLHFSGRGDEKNNFMSEMFLQDENNSQLLLSFHEYTPEVFLQKADSIKQERLNHLNTVSQKRKFSEDFIDLAREIINYENYDLKERYTYLVKKYHKEFSKQFPTNFHDYRKEINFNSVALQCSPAYKRLLENYLINYSLSWCATSELDEDDCYSLTNPENVKIRLRKAGELVQVPTIKENLLEKIAVRGIVMAESRKDIVSILEELKAQKLSGEDLEEMEQLGRIQLAYLPGTSLKGVPLLNMAGQLVKMGDIVKKPTVIFLWSVYNGDHVEEHALINEYRKKYPEVQFVGINMDLDEEPAWRVSVRRHNYNPNTEYQLGTTNINKEFFRYFLDKTLFLDATAEVKVGDTFLTSPEFESRISEFLNQ